MKGVPELVIAHFPSQARVPIRNDADYGAMVAENLQQLTAAAQAQLGPAAELVNFSHCFTLVPSAVIGGGAMLYTSVASFKAYLMAEKLAEINRDNVVKVAQQ